MASVATVARGRRAGDCVFGRISVLNEQRDTPRDELETRVRKMAE
jgi:hypothetical protein